MSFARVGEARPGALGLLFTSPSRATTLAGVTLATAHLVTSWIDLIKP